MQYRTTKRGFMNLTCKRQLLVFRGEETIEWTFTFPYGDSEAAVEPLKKMKPELYGVILGDFGIAAHSATLPVSHPMYRANAQHI
jgi:hypothetical protein